MAGQIDSIQTTDIACFGATFRRTRADGRQVNQALSALSCTLTRPDGTTVDYTISSFRNPAGGRYELDYVTTMPGEHRVTMTGTGGYTDEFGAVRPYTSKVDGTFTVG